VVGGIGSDGVDSPTAAWLPARPTRRGRAKRVTPPWAVGRCNANGRRGSTITPVGWTPTNLPGSVAVSVSTLLPPPGSAAATPASGAALSWNNPRAKAVVAIWSEVERRRPPEAKREA
jgi:hypothetical protein